ncbi:MAG: hypothetical protein JNL60_00830 [Bacteroidia bacterium]|nr:hypothetical protein [Bacteroidia bacterium]
MKKYIFMAALACGMAACSDPMKDEAVIRQKDSLITVISERETTVNDFVASFNEVEANLDSIRIKQHLITENSGKLRNNEGDRKAYINEQIRSINELMVENNKKLKQLDSRLRKANHKNSELEKTIKLLNSQLNRKYQELAELNEKLNNLNSEIATLHVAIDTLSYRSQVQEETIHQNTIEMHTAYYVVGTSKELQKSKLIDKKGGLLGMGRTAKLSDNLDNSLFTKIDYTETKSIPVGSKGAKIITSHPTGSYTMVKDGDMVNSIEINDPAQFWSASKYLVVTK